MNGLSVERIVIQMGRRRSNENVGPRVELLADLARALHGCDTTAGRLEATVARAGRGLGLEVECFASPTALFLGIGDAPARLIRVKPADFDGEALVALDAIARGLEDGSMRLRAARRRLRELGGRAPMGKPIVLGAFAAVSAGAAVLFGAAASEVLAAAVLGVVASAVFAVVPARIAPLATAFFVGIAASAFALWIPLSPERATLAALIVLVPGLSLTLALADLSEGHLVSGTARLSAVGATFLQLGLGAALGWSLPVGDGVLLPAPLGFGAEALALGVTPMGIGVLMRVRSRDWPAMAAATWVGVVVARVVGDLAGAESGAFCGALSVGLAGNLYSRRGVPSPVVMVPGILLLVPGSLGFRGFAALMDAATMQGLEAAVAAVLVAASLVAGLLVAHAVVPERRDSGGKRPSSGAVARTRRK
jgi:uncharacterized membrane protein YjjP (DUF1212 family)